MNRYTPGIRSKLIAIFILIKVIPLIALAWFAWDEIAGLSEDVNRKTTRMISNTHDVVSNVSKLSTQNSIRALDVKSREAIERLTTDTAQHVAAFLYDRDRDILLASRIPTEKAHYQQYMDSRSRPVILHRPWILDDTDQQWLPVKTQGNENGPNISATNEDNSTDFHYRPPDRAARIETRPLYLEMTFVDLEGNEKIKINTSNLLSPDLKNVAAPENTYCQAENYFKELKKLAPGEIYVSEVIGPYVRGHMIGTYNKAKAEKLGIEFAPEKSGYAGKENPVGIRFRGIVRWATPVVENGIISGYVTLALDHTHIMEFTDHLVPTNERYSEISDAGSGNYAFMWDYKGRNISHPRDYFITGYDPETGKPAVPWLDEEMYELWQQTGMSMNTFQAQAPQFKEQALSKKPALSLTREGMLGLDCRYLNFAPQCTGWFNLTQEGGSGSFLIFWSGLWKLTTAATIPYYTGIYQQSPRGFGFVTIGANVDEFHRSAVETATKINEIESEFTRKLEVEKEENIASMRFALEKAFRHLSLYTTLMILAVIFIAIIMAGALTRRITYIIKGIRRFQKGERSYRLKQHSNDEMGQLAQTYNEMADTVQDYIADVVSSKAKLENLNKQLEREIDQRRQVQEELARNKDNLEITVKERTRDLEKEILERTRVEKLQQETEQRLREQNEALLDLAGNQSLYGGDLNHSLDTIVPLAAKILEVNRCGVWLLGNEEDSYVCKKLVIDGNSIDPEDQSLSTETYRKFAAMLSASRSIASEDIANDERLTKNAIDYFIARGIQSTLVASISDDIRPAGFIAFSQILTKREWHLDQINFANSIADIIGLAIGAANRKLALIEKDSLTARLRRAEKMEAIGTLAGGVAHDLNNILSGIVSYPELLLLQLPDDSKLRDPIKTISESGKKAAAIVQDLLTLARRGVAVTEVTNLNRIVEDYLGSPEYLKLISYYPDVRVKTDLDKALLNILGSPVHLTKTLMNLVSNSFESISHIGEISISTENCYIDRPITGYDVVNEGDYAALTVKDTGIGIPPEDLNRIFEPFYTSKKMGRSGSGLGMAVVWGTVKDHQGYIDFKSVRNEGTCFTLYFPVTRKLSDDSQPKSLDAYTGHGELILVVDDVKEQREIASAILTTLGYSVTTLESGENAIAYLRENNVDLVILDMIMDPGIDGLETYQQILSIRPGQKAVIASGFSETERIRQVLRLGASTYLKKPYTIEKIGVAVRSVLDL